MSVASRKRRRAKRGGMLGYLSRIAASIAPREPPAEETPAEVFGRAVAAGAEVYAHPETLDDLRAKGNPLAQVAHPHPYMPRDQLLAMPRRQPGAPWSIGFGLDLRPPRGS